MSCCNKKSLKRVTKIEDGITIAYASNKILVLHKDDIVSFSNDGNNLSISLKVGYTKDFKREELLDFDDVLNQLKNL